MKRVDSLLPIGIGLLMVVIFSLLLYWNPRPIARMVDFLERNAYDLQLSVYPPPPLSNPAVSIIDIDDESLAQEGRWPWNREKVGLLTKRLFEAGAKAVAFDIMFPETATDAEDAAFAEALKAGVSILGFAFKNAGESTGELPPPFLQNDGLGAKIDQKRDYIGNIGLLQIAAKGGGFLNASPDWDGTLRSSPLLLRRGDLLYGSLSLMGIYLFLDSPPIKLQGTKYLGKEVLKGLFLGNRWIPLQPSGKLLIPYRGPPYSFPYYSAKDVLHGDFPKEKIQNHLVLIGTSATALGDLNPSPLHPVFIGVETQASIAQGIIDGYLPYRPAWGAGAEVLLLLGCGLLAALFFPKAHLFWRLVLAIGLPVILIAVNGEIWSRFHIVLSLVFPIVIVEVLFLMNLAWGYFVESKQRSQIRSLFGQYLPNDRIDQILQSGEGAELQGESRELTVLFADIRGFTSMAEKLAAPEVKALLTNFFTPMTEVIFKHRGTIDKYVGDLVMAFWGAPLEDAAHALHAIEAALDMQQRLEELNREWKQEGKAEIHIGIGVNTGMMHVGDMGSRFRRAYTVLGDAVNLASRLEGLSKYYHVPTLVGEATYQQTKDQIGYRKLDRVRVLGKQKSVEIFEPLGLKNQLTAADLKNIDDSSQALEAYFARNWKVAKECFLALQQTDPIWAGRFLERIQKHEKEPPSSDWDGSFILEMK